MRLKYNEIYQKQNTFVVESGGRRSVYRWMICSYMKPLLFFCITSASYYNVAPFSEEAQTADTLSSLK